MRRQPHPHPQHPRPLRRDGRPYARPYRSVQVNGRLVGLHRLIMERHLGRKLRRCEHVHHKNGNGHDNRLGNLEVLHVSAHVALHQRVYGVVGWCYVCGRPFLAGRAGRGQVAACGRSCAARWRERVRRHGLYRAAQLAALRRQANGYHAG